MLEHFCECYSDLSGPILCPVLGSIIPLFIPNSRIRPIRLIGLCASLITFLYSPVPRIQFDPSTAKSQFVESLRWLPYENINLNLGIDGLSFFFVILTTFLIPICILVGWSGMRSYGKEYITASLIREFLMIAVFCMLDPLLFYVLPESVLIPMLCGAEHLLFAGIKLFLCRGLVQTSTRLLGSCMDMQEGVLLGVCRGCVCSREWIPRQVSLGGVDTLARIPVTATRDKSKGNCTQPGMDVNSPHSIFLPNEPFFVLDLEDGHCVRFERHGFHGLMTRADDGSSGRSRMMRKSHVRFPEKGVATYWSFDQPPPVNSALGHPLLYHYYRAILLILFQTGTADLQISLTTEFSERRQIFLWIASFAAFAVKVPMVPVHIWLPEAHVEAPTAGSVILAGIPSKLGTHGFLRFSIPMFPEATLCSTPFIYTPSAIAIIYTSLTTSRQIDLKKIIAYSSVAHMNLVTIGMFSRAAAVRSPIFSYGHTRQGQNMCAGRATHQPTSNGGENIACRNT
ncbi:hypothetical protein VNO80_06728 [Phaseolus coccineus]|uniref:NADH-ubiquinone oxidoreductase chain 4 n=1 Tax=Phaseolus coccineus TaxID=3886 RepID=A0AAN9RHV5_PHACN